MPDDRRTCVFLLLGTADSVFQCLNIRDPRQARSEAGKYKLNLTACLNPSWYPHFVPLRFSRTWTSCPEIWPGRQRKRRRMARRGWSCGVCEAANQPSACLACINFRLQERYGLLRKLRQEQEHLRQALDAELLSKREADRQHYWRVEHAERKEKLAEQLEAMRNELPEVKAKLRRKQKDLNARTEFLSEASSSLLTKRMEQLGHNRAEPHHAESLGLTAATNELLQKWRVVLRQLCKILPVRQGGDSKDNRDGPNTLRIGLARLPNEDDPHSVPAPELAASLGYVVQLVNLAARYLSAPLLHSAGFAASSSRVWQRNSYWDARPASRSEEYPLFFVSGTGMEDNMDHRSFDSESVQDLGFSSVKRPTFDATAGRVSSIASNSTFTDYDRDVRQGILMLKRSIACVCCYIHGSVSLPAPSATSTFEAFFEMLTSLSLKQSRVRSLGVTHQQLSTSRQSISDPVRALDVARTSSNSKVPQKTAKNLANSSYEFLSDSIRSEVMQKVAETMFDGWDMIERPAWPPPPSHPEDVEHWMRAMFTDAVK